MKMAVRLPAWLFSPATAKAESTAKLCISAVSAVGERIVRAMSSPPPASYTTLKERATCEREIKRSKFIAIAAPISDERSAHSFLSEVQDLRASHNCWAYKLGDQYRSNDDGEPSGTAGRPIYSAIVSSGVDMVMVVVIRNPIPSSIHLHLPGRMCCLLEMAKLTGELYFGGIKLGTGGLARAYGGVALDCLKGATTCFVKPKVPLGMEVPFELVGPVYHQLQSFHVEDIKQDYDTGKDGFTMLTFRVDHEKIEDLENAINSTCSRKIGFYKQ
ncbi:hypothetical protein MA16_Dca027156 [Dendrobium catenatum]|uniref:Impact N-terminal domain-containing protein n=1 Tax=Dendrobium catenatum TaxID=906689 RepID=A0A2I0W2B9_9ASPA|nr:hypothetical protein MA16_Dca027156 [Dendrobium catenatum]